MTYPEKQKLYKTWLQEWGTRLEKIPAILGYLADYPDLIAGLNRGNLPGADELHESQLEWVSLVAQLDNPIETSYFRNYWVPIQKEPINCFIDLSTDEYPIFDSLYFMGKPYQWYTKYIVNNLNDLLLKIDDPVFDLVNYKRRNEEMAEQKFEELLEDYDELGFAGEQEFVKPGPLWLCKEGKTIQFKLENNKLIIKNAESYIISILPLDTEIKIKNISTFHNRYDNAKPKIKTIKAFCHLILGAGIRDVGFYSIALNNKEGCYATFKNNRIVIRHTDVSVLKTAMEQFELYQKEYAE